LFHNIRIFLPTQQCHIALHQLKKSLYSDTFKKLGVTAVVLGERKNRRSGSGEKILKVFFTAMKQL